MRRKPPEPVEEEQPELENDGQSSFEEQGEGEEQQGEGASKKVVMTIRMQGHPVQKIISPKTSLLSAKT